MIYTRLAVAMLATGLLWAVPGCVRESGACDYETSGGLYHMSVTVVTGYSSATRAGHTDDSQEPGTEAENYIDFQGNDFRIVIFDNSGNYLLSIGGSDNWTVLPEATDGQYSIYRMECEIDPKNFPNGSIDDIKNSGFQVMMLANWQNAQGADADAYDVLDEKKHTTADIWKNGTDYNFEYKYTTSGTGNTSWSPAHNETPKRLIPMFGYATGLKFDVKRADGGLLSNTTIMMQRAVAKVEVLKAPESGQPLHVAEVTMSKFNTRGRFIPDVQANPDWNKPGQQVDVSSLPNPVVEQSGLKFFDAEDRWVAYVPEMELGASLDNSRPHLDIKIDVNEDNEELGQYYQGGTYTAHFAKYEQNTNPTIPDDSWKHILRNHIYRFTVNMVGFDLAMHLHVMPWDVDDEEVWDFTDNITVQNTLDWMWWWKQTIYNETEDKYEEVEKWETEEGKRNDNGDTEIVLSLVQGRYLEGSFRISTPLNGRWYARLTPIDDAKTTAITFTDKNGDVMQPATGDPEACMELSKLITTSATSDPTVFYIRPTNYGNDQASRFKLEFFVENLGIWTDVTKSVCGDKNYIIVRPANIIE